MSRLYYRGGPSAYRNRVISSQRGLCVFGASVEGEGGITKATSPCVIGAGTASFLVSFGGTQAFWQEIRTPTSPSYVTSGYAPTGDPALRNSGLWPMVARNEPNAMHNSGQSSGPARLGPGAPEEGLGRRIGAARTSENPVEAKFGRVPVR